MPTLNQCPKCGRVLEAASGAGICAACLLEAGIAGNASAPRSSQTTSFESKFLAPSLAELAHHFPQLELLELLGQGGMGAVYKAKQTRLDRLVAIKILPKMAGQEAEFATRFAREAQTMARLNHPNIVAIHDYGEAAGWFFFIMEYVDGVNLRQAIQAKSVQPKEALLMVGQVCDALQYAHEEGVVHRDIKPENILLDKRGRVKIADFGLAKLLSHSTQDRRLTHTHQVMGTVGYMAPEQMEGSKEVDHRADLYALGVVFYELLTGELPMGLFAPPSQKIQVDVRIDDVVLKTLEKEPNRRYQQASLIKQDVERISSGPVQVKKATAESWMLSWLECNQFLLGIASFLLIGLGAGFLVWIGISQYRQELLMMPFQSYTISMIEAIGFCVGSLLPGVIAFAFLLRMLRNKQPAEWAAMVFRIVAVIVLTIGILFSAWIIWHLMDGQRVPHSLSPIITFYGEALGWGTGMIAGGIIALIIGWWPLNLQNIRWSYWLKVMIIILMILAVIAMFLMPTQVLTVRPQG